MDREPVEQEENDLGTAGVIARPPRLFLLALLLGHALDHLLPLRSVGSDGGVGRWIIGGILFLSGVALTTAGIRNFSRARTPVPTIEPTRTLVMTGIHGWSRNPIYVGLFFMYSGIGVATQSPWTLILLLPLAITIRYGVVAREEVYLERRFGDAYRTYKARVRRWL
jgi:protein-S-isoprenylcysteine O-methyltransferase Ste14